MNPVNDPTAIAQSLDLHCITARENFLGDEHYAISEAVLDEARASHGGNWMVDAHNQFKDTFGEVIELDTIDDDTDAEPDDCRYCQVAFCPGVCRNALPGAYFNLLEQVKDLLRTSRGERREQGFVANHIPVLFSNQPDSKDFQHVHMLTRISFSPFDATAMEMTLIDSGARAKLKVDSETGKPIFRPLPRLLLEMSSVDPPMKLYTCTYRAISLEEICIDDEFVLVQAAKPTCDENSQSSDDNDARCFLAGAILKRALGKGRGRGRRGKGSGRKSRGRQCSSSSRKVQKQTQTSKRKSIEAEAELPNVADKVSQEIENEWHKALESQLGPVPSSKTSSSTVGTGTPASSSRAPQSSAIPVVSKEYPWTDEKGHCWVFNHESQKPYHIGPSSCLL